jgi:hypothetical protein
MFKLAMLLAVLITPARAAEPTLTLADASRFARFALTGVRQEYPTKWLLVHLLKEFPDLPEAPDIRASLDENLTRESIKGELAYLEGPERKSFERTYGWAWLLKLAVELHSSGDPDCQRWFTNLKPLADAISVKYVEFLPQQTYPIRTGVQTNRLLINPLLTPS